MSKKPKSDWVKDGVDDIMADLDRIGAVSEVTMREYKSLDVPEPKLYSAKDVARIRKHMKVSQSVFARLLNSKVSTVQKWEIGDKQPSGLANKLLYIAETKGVSGLI